MDKIKTDKGTPVSKERRKQIKNEHKKITAAAEAENRKRWEQRLAESSQKPSQSAATEGMAKNQNKSVVDKNEEGENAGAAIAKFVFGAFLVISVVLGIASCDTDHKESTSKNKSQIDRCIGTLNDQIRVIDSYFARHKPDGSEFAKLRQAEREELISALADAKETLAMVVRERKIRKDKLKFSDEYICLSDTIYDEYDRAYFELKRRGDIERIEAMNKEIDAALDGVIEDYKQKAIEHRVLNGSGGRIDQFVMEDGRLVHCRTKVTDTGKSVSCD